MASVVACSSSNLLKAKYFRFEASFCFDSVSIFKIQAIKVSVLGKTQIIQLFQFLNNQVFAGFVNLFSWQNQQYCNEQSVDKFP